jgi:elongation factor P
MAGLIEAIDIKRRTFFESEGVPFTAIDVDISRPTARGGQTLVRIKMRNLITRAVFDRTYKAGETFQEPDLEMVPASYLYGGNDGYNFMDQNTYDTLTLGEDMIGDDRQLLVENQLVQIQKFNGRPIGVSLPQHVELSVASTEPAVRGDTASGGATKIAVLETGLSVRVPLFIEEGERVRVHTETREFVGRA